MGEREYYQPLTRWDKISVILYRAGIVLSTLFILAGAWLASSTSWSQASAFLTVSTNALVILLYAAVGMSVFLIHLYIGKFHRALKKLYYVAVIALILSFVIGSGDAAGVLIGKAYGPLLLLPLAGCLGFITAKEAFCFRLAEGYLLAMAMPLYLIILAFRMLTAKEAFYGLILIAALFVLFTFRKVFMPLHYDIGDKSAYT